MNISPLQAERLKYAPKLPGMLRNGISEICVKEGEATQSVADQEKIKALFPNTYGEKVQTHLQLRSRLLVLSSLVDRHLADTMLFVVYMML